MRLRCKVCQAIQPVTVADEADEDPRTQFIRRAFRAEHVASCGEGAVRFELSPIDVIEIDHAAWTTYVDTLRMRMPEDVTLGEDGFCFRQIVRDGQIYHVRVCEDCWRTIPRYVEYPFGLTSPESDGAGGAVPKWRPDHVDTEAPQRSQALLHLPKAVCVPCYVAAFRRVYPEATIPILSEAVVGDGTPITPPLPVEAESVGRVAMSSFDWVEEVTGG